MVPICDFTELMIKRMILMAKRWIRSLRRVVILGFTRSLARELGPRGIRVNAVSPGWVMTERQLRQFVTPAVKRLIKKSQCVPVLIQPGEIASVVLFLASEVSRAITGQEILADRGWAHS